MQIITIIFFIFCASAKYPHPAYTLYKHPIETGARCLDGSQSTLYYSLGSQKNSNKIMIYFRGGNHCHGNTYQQTLLSCYQRSLTQLGSSKNLSHERMFQQQGLLSSKQEINPVFHDWTRIFINYCDGSEYQGHKENPITFNGVDLYFRGAANVKQHFKYLNLTFGLYSADTVVISGFSAGGIAVFFWSNYVYQRSINKRVFSIPDSGLFLIEYFHPITQEYQLIKNSRSLYELIVQEIPLSMPECQNQLDDPINCFNAVNLAKFFKTPTFIIQSQYDRWYLQFILKFKCLSRQNPASLANCSQRQIQVIQQHRSIILQTIANITSLINVPFGVWSPSCVQHGFMSSSFTNPKYKIPTTTGITVSQAIMNFLKNPSSLNHIYIDEVSWPRNKECSGLQQLSIDTEL